MTKLKLAKLPDRTPFRLTLVLAPEVKARLEEYAAAYAEAYDSREALPDLAAAMLVAFLDSDRHFSRGKR